MHRLVFALVALLILASPAAALQDGSASRRALAQELVELSQGPNLRKTIENSIRQQMTALPKEMPADQRRWLADQVPERALRMLDLLMEDMVEVYADHFTVEELQAQIAFSQTPVGRSIANKMGELSLASGEAIMARQLEYQTDLMADFSKAFDCGEPSTK